MFNRPRKFTHLELAEIQELNRIVFSEKFKAIQIKNNTALIPDGQKLAVQTQAVADLLENKKSEWISQKLAQLGYKANVKVSVNLENGKIVEV